MEHDQNATEIYRVRKERREEIERTLENHGREEMRLSNDLQKECSRYLLLGGIGSIAAFRSFGLTEFWFWFPSACCGVAGLLAFASIFSRSQAHYHDGNYYFAYAHKQLKHFSEAVWTPLEEKRFQAEWLLAERWKATSMILFYVGVLAFVAGVVVAGVSFTSVRPTPPKANLVSPTPAKPSPKSAPDIPPPAPASPPAGKR